MPEKLEELKALFMEEARKHNVLPLDDRRVERFNSDLAGSDHDIFYGLHSAITRRDKEQKPPEGWYPEERMTAEEALRGYTVWNAYAAGQESETGTLEPGKRADVTILSIDPLAVGETAPGRLFEGTIVATIVGGKVIYEAR